MKERPIIFSAPMVRAILDGRKTQTRRVVRGQPRAHLGLQPMHGVSPDGVAFGDPALWRVVGPDYPDCDKDDRRCPYGQPGDHLWVRETFWQAECQGQGSGNPFLFYDADQDEGPQLIKPFPWFDKVGRWGKRPSIHMPRWASRITLEVVSVRVERLHCISQEDANAEGIVHDMEQDRVILQGFYRAWEAINGKRPGCSWNDNPWIWVVEFKRVVS